MQTIIACCLLLTAVVISAQRTDRSRWREHSVMPGIVETTRISKPEYSSMDTETSASNPNFRSFRPRGMSRITPKPSVRTTPFFEWTKKTTPRPHYNTDTIMFPDDRRLDSTEGPLVQPVIEDFEDNLNYDRLPLDELFRINELGSIARFVSHFNLSQPEEVEEEDVLHVRFAGRSEPRAMATMAGCEPELQAVELELPPIKPGILYYPTCTRVKRCGGCCVGSQLECLPIKSKHITLNVLKASKSTGRRRNRRRAQTAYHEVQVEEHEECVCRCKVQEKHCHAVIHSYDSKTCQCKCKNTDEKSKCESKAETHYWNSSKCRCLCHASHSPCSTGMEFSHDSCRCEVSARAAVDADDADDETPTVLTGMKPIASLPRPKPVAVPVDSSYSSNKPLLNRRDKPTMVILN